MDSVKSWVQKMKDQILLKSIYERFPINSQDQMSQDWKH